jgi:hypothetical protein
VSWDSKTLRGVAEVVLGRQRTPQQADGPHMVPYLRAANVRDGQLDLIDVMSMNFSPSEQQIFSLRSGDVLVTEGSGSLSTVGASAAWSGELRGTVCFQNTLLRMRPKQNAIDGRFLLWWARAAMLAACLPRSRREPTFITSALSEYVHCTSVSRLLMSSAVSPISSTPRPRGSIGS